MLVNPQSTDWAVNLSTLKKIVPRVFWGLKYNNTKKKDFRIFVPKNDESRKN